MTTGVFCLDKELLGSLELNRIYQQDCLEGMKMIPEKSINLICIDPPYNIGKDKNWDKWKTVESYVSWMGEVFIECERVLKDNGSFYFFHNDFLQIVELQNWLNKNNKFVFKQMIVWNKRYQGSPRKFYFDNVIKTESSRMFRQLSEYCLFYTFQDDTGLSKVMLDVNNFPAMRRYFKELQTFIGLNKKQILGKIGQKADHCFRWNSSQWDMPTKETYEEMIVELKIDTWSGFREYEDLRSGYEALRQEYEDLRYTFNTQKTHHDVWDYEVAKKQGHVTPKPVELIENIIRHSSNEGDIVLDCFMGSGTTAVAAKNLKRKFIGFERESKYIEIANIRLDGTEPITIFDEVTDEELKG